MKLLPLPSMCTAWQAEVVTIQCDDAVTCRLAALGILPGCRLTLARVARDGAVVVNNSGTLLALSQSVSQRILVRRDMPDSQHTEEKV